jgi:osmotically-inducible protein OsmY
MKTDAELQKDILEELSWDPLIPEAGIGVAVAEGVVTLSGHLQTYAEKVAVIHAVERVSGVKAVAVEIEVVPAGMHPSSDTEIASALEHALNWNTSIPRDRVKVMVEKGWVTLSGELDWNFQREACERLARPLRGVVGITNTIGLKPVSVPVSISSRIEAALIRQVLREAKRIEVSVDGNVVTLKGHVHSWAERNAVEGVAWSAPGINRVNSQLTVEP